MKCNRYRWEVLCKSVWSNYKNDSKNHSWDTKRRKKKCQRTHALCVIFGAQFLTQTLTIPFVQKLHWYSDINAGHHKLLFVFIYIKQQFAKFCNLSNINRHVYFLNNSYRLDWGFSSLYIKNNIIKTKIFARKNKINIKHCIQAMWQFFFKQNPFTYNHDLHTWQASACVSLFLSFRA